jgi:ATP-dependent Lon protease
VSKFDLNLMYPVLPLRGNVVPFPKMVFTLFIGRKRSEIALTDAIQNDTPILIVAQKNDQVVDPGPDDLHSVGVMARILQSVEMPESNGKRMKILVEGLMRARVTSMKDNSGYYVADVEEIQDVEVTEKQETLLRRAVTTQLDQYLKVNPDYYADVEDQLIVRNSLSVFVDLLVGHLPLPGEFKQSILETSGVQKRAEELICHLQREIEWSKEEKQLQDELKTKMSEEQKNYLLRLKYEELKKKLYSGAEGTEADEYETYKKKFTSIGLTENAQKKLLNELDKLKLMPAMSAEATVIRNYFDCIVELPWTEKSTLNASIKDAEKSLNTDHYGLEEVKEQIIEHIAVQFRVRKIKGPILCLVGPPGVGKTSLGKSIAKAMGRQFVRIAMGGVRDEAEIRGHRRTYIGAMTGRILAAMKTAEVTNPLILLDEIDKMGTDFRGDPASALLEVLDKEQNKAFIDHYLELPYDLSDVMFITTANTLDIPDALRDRLEVIRIAGYTEQEKFQIANKYLLPKCFAEVGMKEGEVAVSKGVLTDIIRYYTREAGVRELERKLAKVSRKFVCKMVRSGSKEQKKQFIQVRNLQEYLGVRKYRVGKANLENRVGLVRGLAWTSVGGELLTIEAAALAGSEKLICTGSLGKVMQESIKAALSVIRSRAGSLGIDKEHFKNSDVHVHVPEGATPKDGPSAGVGIAVALASALLGVPVRAEVAMTGEITLRGEVLEIGGLKEKLLAAVRGGIRLVLIPEQNQKDLKDIPEELLQGIEVRPIRWVEEAFLLALLESKDLASNRQRKGVPVSPASANLVYEV